MLMELNGVAGCSRYNGETSLVTEHFNLQSKALSVLSPDQSWLHVRDHDDWADVLLSSNKEMIRIYDNSDSSKLVAHSVALFPDADNPNADVLDMNVDALPEKITTLASVTSDPDCRGRGLMSCMIKEWEKLADYSNRSHLLSVVNTDNVASWAQFVKNGFNVVGSGYDELDNAHVYFVMKVLNETSSADTLSSSMTDVSILRYDTPLDEMKDIFSQGWVGVAPEREGGDRGRYTGNLILRLDNA